MYVPQCESGLQILTFTVDVRSMFRNTLLQISGGYVGSCSFQSGDLLSREMAFSAGFSLVNRLVFKGGITFSPVEAQAARLLGSVNSVCSL